MEISKENVEDVYWLLFGNYSKMWKKKKKRQ
jgi:hypothetical protein